MERKKPRLLIIGHARHGKDSFAELVTEVMDLSFVSSSEFVGRVAIWPIWGKERYAAFSDMFDDRVNYRSLWYNLISAYNTPDAARTGSEMMKDHDMYVGMRSMKEFNACMDKGLFSHVIWVDGSKRHPPENKDSNEMTRDLADIWIDNNGPEDLMRLAVANFQKRLHKEGYDVNYVNIPVPFTPGIINPPVLDPKYTAVEDNSLSVGEDPYDPPQQTPIGGREKAWDDMSNEETMTDESDLLAVQELDEAQDAAQGMMDAAEEIQKMIVNPTLKESQKFHNDALKASLKVARKLDNVENGPPLKKMSCDVTKMSPIDWEPGLKPFKMLPEEEKWVDTPEGSKDNNNLGWKEKPEGTIKVLDHGFFGVLSVMGTDQSIADAARMSYGRGTKKSSSTAGLINYLVRHKHTSPLEMAEIKFHIRMPIFVMRQWVRHRTANLNEYSGRYSEMVRLWYVPELNQICLQDKTNKQGSAEPMDKADAEDAQRTIWETSNLAFNAYEELLAEGVSRETARIILPLNTYTEVVWKLDISNLIKFLWLRDDDHAQWEIRQYAQMVARAVKEYFPLVYAAYQEARQSKTFTMDEIRALITGDPDNLSKSQTQEIVLLRHNILS